MLSFKTHGNPVGKGSKRAFPNPKTGGVIVTDSAGKNLKMWEAGIRIDALAAIRSYRLSNPGATKSFPVRGPLSLTARFYLQRAKRPAKGLEHFPMKKPDIDKALRAVLDAMTGVVYVDDVQVVSIDSVKVYGEPGVEVEVRFVD